MTEAYYKQKLEQLKLNEAKNQQRIINKKAQQQAHKLRMEELEKKLNDKDSLKQKKLTELKTDRLQYIQEKKYQTQLSIMTREAKRKALFDMKMQRVGIDPNKMEQLEANK